MSYRYIRSVPVSADFSTNALRLLNESSKNFVILAVAAGIDPATDLVGTDLSGVNFSDCDLSGYNFTNCDLRGAYGSNVLFDETTNFTGALVEGSLFYYFKEVSIFSDEFAEKEYLRLRANYWGAICDWIARSIGRDARENDRAMAIRLFFDTKDLTVKTDILLRMKNIFVNIEDYRKFLVNIILRQSNDVRAMRAAIQAASRIINSDHFLFRTILAYARTAEYGLSISLMSQLIRSQFFSKHVDDIREIINANSDYKLRVSFLRRVNKIYRYCPEEYIQVDDGQFLDFGVAIEKKQFLKVLSFSFDRLYSAQIGILRTQSKLSDRELSKQARSNMALDILSSLRKFETNEIYLVSSDLIDEEVSGFV
ncbi:pentapeptide repeat-containing protein [Mesorhizobium sp. B263B2A]|uniref:pentapeptide repeat-containing protein n=1 Tax=Mesorhizobium sp. B263B2A TaxID=2876669 RepID=UPI001CD0763B|nr:pentapeptide repeat-containing protein [Mesorhizobium sp. B263B2A]MCA0029590.1 pentapeptide repeat-containing protein [Mesorhizobium sp. B263B2A]